LQVGSIDISLHLVFEVTAFFIAFRYYLWLRKKHGDIIDSDNRLWIIIGAVFGAFIGSRLIGGLENPPAMLQSKNILWYFYLNKTVLGGFFGGLLGVELIKKIIGESNASGDLFTYPMILGLMIGRVGCFTMGVYEETYGTPTKFFTGMNLGDGIHRHPVTLYEIGFLAMLWLFLILLERKYRLKNGARFKIFLFSYFVFRFACDFIKPGYNIIFGLTVIQLTSLSGMIWYYRYIIHPKLLVK
jgi:prolipoprotein diacylglyceryltransferase